MNSKRKILLFVPSTNQDKQLEVLLHADEIEFRLIAIESLSQALGEFTTLKSIPLLKLSFRKTIRCILKNTRSIRNEICEFRPNIIESHGVIPGLLTAITFLCFPKVRHSTTRFVYFRHHNLNHHIMKNRVAILVDKLISATHDYIVAPSRQTASVLVAEGARPDKIRVIPHQLSMDKILHMTNVEYEKLSSTTSRVEIIAVGRIDWQKNYPMMLETMRLLVGKNPNFHLRIFGAGNTGEVLNLILQIEKLGLSEKISLQEWTPTIELEIIRSDIFLHTAIDESYGLVLAEALSLGIPIVSNWAGGAADLAVFLGTSPIAYTPSDLAEELFRIISDLPSANNRAKEIQNEFNLMMAKHNVVSQHLELIAKGESQSIT